MALEIKTTYKISDQNIDDYNRLNNAQAVLYFDKARIALQEKAGLKESELAEKDLAFIVHKSYYKYKKQVKPNSEIEIHSRFEEYKEGEKVHMRHAMYVEDQLMASAKTEHAFINLEKSAVIDPLEEFIEKINTLTPA